MEKLGPNEFKKITDALYGVSTILIEFENVENKQDAILIRNLEHSLNEIFGELHAYQLGYKQEV